MSKAVRVGNRVRARRKSPSKFEQIEALEDVRENAVEQAHAFLRRHGWEYRCDFPGSRWLWCKKIKTRLIAVESDMAITIEANL